MKLLDIKEVQEMQLELMKKLHAFMKNQNISYYLIAGSALGAIRHGGFIPWDDDIDIGMFRVDYERFLSVCGSFDKSYDIVNFRNAKNCDYCLTRIYFPNTYIDNQTTKGTKLDSRLYFDIFPLDNVPDDDAERLSYERKIVKQKILISRVDARDYHTSAKAMLAKKVISACLRPFRGQILKKTDALMRKYERAETTLVCSLSSQYSFAKQVMPKTVYGKPTLCAFADTEFYVPEQLDTYLSTLYGADYMQVPPESKRRKGYDIYIV